MPRTPSHVPVRTFVSGEPPMPRPLTTILQSQAKARRLRPHTVAPCFACGRPVSTTVRLASGFVVHACPAASCPDRARG